MKVSSLTLNGLRSHGELATFRFHPNTTLIIGQNGTGKTTILEGVYLLHRGTSFRGRDRDMIPHASTRSELKLTFDDNSARRGKLDISVDGKITKVLSVGDKTSARLSAKDRLPVVLFEPDELRLLTSSPQRRRDFIDGIIARISPTYSTVLNRFARTLAQRNELLKQFESMKRDVWESHLFAWDVKFAELSATIIKARSNFLEHANKHLPRLYSDLAGAQHTVSARYESVFALTETLQQKLLALLESTRQSDGLRGYTSVGPHRDDVTLTLDEHPASESASRGEMRTIMLAFKLLEVELQEHHSGAKPLILLDDVFSELDSEREAKLIKTLDHYQTIITATDLRHHDAANSSVIRLST